MSRQKGSSFEQTMIEELGKWAEKAPDRPVVGVVGSDEEVLTRQDIYTHVRDHTQLGQKLLKSWEQLAVRHLRKGFGD